MTRGIRADHMNIQADPARRRPTDRPTAALTGPGVIAGSRRGLIRMPRAMVSQDVALVGLERHQLTATAGLVWNGDLPRPLQQILFDAADGITAPAPAPNSEREPAASGLCPRSPDPPRTGSPSSPTSSNQ